MNTDAEIIEGLKNAVVEGTFEVFIPGATGDDYEGDLDATNNEIDRLNNRSAELGEVVNPLVTALRVQYGYLAFAGGHRCMTPGCTNRVIARGALSRGVCRDHRN
jgi:hypothetical protein